MARGWVDRILVFMGIQDEPVEPTAEPQPAPERMHMRPEAPGGPQGSASANGIQLGPDGMPTTQVMVLRPRLFEDVQLIAGMLKEERPVVVRLDSCSKELAQRIIDFVSGATYVLDGHMQRLSDNIFLFTPRHISIGAKEDEDEREDEKEAEPEPSEAGAEGQERDSEGTV